MSTEKGTMDIFNLNYDIFSIMVEERFNKNITKKDIYQIINRSYGIKGNIKVNMLKYSNELASMSKKYKEDKCILYTFFDITLGIITKKIINKDDASKLLDEMIMNRMCELTGNSIIDFEHKNKN